MLKFLTDENLDNDILRGIQQRQPAIDIVRIQDIGLRTADDPAVLEWAASEDRILLTHDVNTMPKFAYERIEADDTLPGIFVIPKDMAIGQAIEDVILLAECSYAAEWNGRVGYLPLQ